MSRGASPGGSPGGSPRSDNKGPSALRNELAAAKKAVEVLKMEKDATQEKLEKLHNVLETERSALREVLQAARKAVDDLKLEKEEVETNYTNEQKVTKEQAEEIERLKKLIGSTTNVQIDNTQIDILNQQITQIRNEMQSLQQQLDASRRSESDLRSQLSSSSSAEAESTQLRATIRDLQAQLAAAAMPASDDGKTRQLEGLHKKNLMKLMSVQRECGIRWMNHILARHRLHNNVFAFVWWRCYANGKMGSSSTGDMNAQMLDQSRRHDQAMKDLAAMKDEELKAQLAQAGRGLKRWMEEREAEGGYEKMRRKQQAVKMLANILAKWCAGTKQGCVIQFKINYANANAGNVEGRRNEDMVRRLRALRRQSAVLAMKEILMRWMHAQIAGGFMRFVQNFSNDKSLKRMFHLESQSKDAGMASYWKDEAERVAALFDKRKAAFEATQRDHEYRNTDLTEKLTCKVAELEKMRAEYNVAVGDLAHQMNQSETDRENSERLTSTNVQLENVVRNHVVEGVVMRGKLNKQGSISNSNTNPRWCVLDARQFSCFEGETESLAKTVIPLKDILHIKADSEWKKHGFEIQLVDTKEARENQKSDVFRFEAHSHQDLDAWLDNLTKLHGNNDSLKESWDSIRQNYVDQITIEQDRLTVLQQNFTTYKTDCTQKAGEHLSSLQEKYEALMKGQSKIEDDLWMWVERHMWQQTSAQGLGFGEQKMAQALGGAGGVPCHIATNWTDSGGANAGAEVDEHCSAANDGKNTTYTVNFECPSDQESVMAVIKIQKQQVVAAPPVPIKDPKEEVKKLQRLMVLRNPSPPRSRQRGAGDHSASPRGKSPPKKRGTGSISNSPSARGR